MSEVGLRRPRSLSEGHTAGRWQKMMQSQVSLPLKLPFCWVNHFSKANPNSKCKSQLNLWNSCYHPQQKTHIHKHKWRSIELESLSPGLGTFTRRRNRWNLSATWYAFDPQARDPAGWALQWANQTPWGRTCLQKHLQDNVQPTTVTWPGKQCLDPLHQTTASTRCFHEAASGVAGEFLAGRKAHRGKSSVPVCLWKC